MHMGKIGFTKILSLSMAVLFAASVSACSSHKRKNNVIDESDTWYDCNSFEVSNLYPDDIYDYSEFTSCGTVGEEIYIYVQAMKRYDGNYKDMTEEEYLNFYEQSVLKFSFDGELLDKIDYVASVNNGSYRLLQKAWVSDNRLNTLEENYNKDTKELIYYLNGEELIMPDQYNDFYYDSFYINDIYTVNGYTLFASGYSGRALYIKNPDGEVEELYLDSAINGGIDQLGEFIQGEEGTVILPVYLQTHEVVFASVDPATGDVSELEGLYGTDGFWVEYASGKQIARDINGFNLLDEETGELEHLFDYNDVDELASEVMEAQCFYISGSGDELILGIETYGNDGSYWNGYGYKIMHLSKASSNPHAGKTELILSTSDDYYFPETADFAAMKKFNDTNGSYFIKFVLPYDISEDDMPVYKDVDYDIILSYDPTPDPSDGIRYVDLAQYLDAGSDSFGQEYFVNAFDAAKSGDALYRAPLDISADGIITASSNMPEGQNGFTFESYVKFVDEVCNGADPMSRTSGYQRGKTDYFTSLFMNMSDVFIYDGKVHFDTDEFRELIMFVDEHGLDEELVSEGGYYDEYYGEHSLMVQQVMDEINDRNARLEGRTGAVYGKMYSFSSYVECYLMYGDGIGLFGLPSFDGRGPMSVSHDYVSVSADSGYPEACADFVKMLLSYDIQKTMDGNPVNREALRSKAEVILAEYNRMVAEGGMSYYQHAEEVPAEAIDRYINILGSSYGGINVGETVEQIIHEEAGAYFNGRRSLDDVINVMSKRVQTALDEAK